MARKKAVKKPFPLLSDEFKAGVDGAKEEELKNKVVEAQFARLALKRAKEDDQDYQKRKQDFKIAGEIYREGDKYQLQKIQYIRSTLDARGKDVGAGYNAQDVRDDMAVGTKVDAA